MEINDLEKQKILSDILNSHDFKDSKRYQDLLKYLVKKSEMAKPFKEIEIAIDVFDKDSSFDPNTNPLIRSYVSNLRKKLEHYYLTTDDKYNYRLEIPKGQYLVNFVHSSNSNGNNKPKTSTKYAYISIIILLTISVIYLALTPSKVIKIPASSTYVNNPVWKEFLKTDGLATTIVLGDYLFMTNKTADKDRIFIRNTKINNSSEFRDYFNKYPNIYGKYKILNFTYLRPSAAFGLLEVLDILGNSSKIISIKLASQLKWEDLEKHNIIYIGTFKTLYRLDTLISKTNIKFGVEPSSIEITSDKGNEVKSFNVQWTASNYQSDYGLLLKMPSSEGNTIIFCLGFSEIGVMDAVNSGVDSNFVPRIEKYLNTQIPKTPLYFEMVSQCEGIELTAFKSNIKYFSFLPSNKK